MQPFTQNVDGLLIVLEDRVQMFGQSEAGMGPVYKGE